MDRAAAEDLAGGIDAGFGGRHLGAAETVLVNHKGLFFVGERCFGCSRLRVGIPLGVFGGAGATGMLRLGLSITGVRRLFSLR